MKYGNILSFSFYFLERKKNIMMKLINNHGHYEMYIDGKFVGSYDTVVEAADDYEKILKKEEEEKYAV